jgi:hypothetical protein
MAIIVGHGGISSRVNTITNRTAASGGSIGGNKKPGIVTRSGVWFSVSRSAMWRAPQTQPTLASLYLFTNRHPVQGSRYQVSRSAMI